MLCGYATRIVHGHRSLDIMNILYHMTIPPPQRPGCEAISQEISALRTRFNGGIVYLNPNRSLPVCPRLLFGFHKLRRLHTVEAHLHIHHLYNPDPFPFPVLRVLRRPVVYSLTGGVEGKRINKRFFASLAAVTVADRISRDYLIHEGLENVFLARPGIDTGRFTQSSLPLGSETRLMVGSAPWVRSQFKTKGVSALLQAAQQLPRLHLVFLWRGLLTAEMQRRVHRMGLEGRVQILDSVVDVNQVLAGVHASVTLAAEPDIVRAYPHSLLESLAAGKPILVSRAIPMALYAEEEECGVVVEAVSSTHIIDAIERLEESYSDLQRAAGRVGRVGFSQQQMVDSYEDIYRQVLAPAH